MTTAIRVCVCMKPQCSQLASSPELLLSAGGAIGQPWTHYWLLSQSTLRRSSTRTVNRSEHPTRSPCSPSQEKQPQERIARSPSTASYTATLTTSTCLLTASYMLLPHVSQHRPHTCSIIIFSLYLCSPKQSASKERQNRDWVYFACYIYGNRVDTLRCRKQNVR